MSNSTSSSIPDDAERRIEAVADEYLADLQTGIRPDVAALLAAHADIAEPLRKRLALVERLFKAARVVDSHRFPADRAQRLKCPHCGNHVQLVEPRPKEVTCLNCGSSFRVEPDTTATFRGAGPPGTVGRFQVLELLGRGAFGEVYKARDSELDRFVALKVPRVDYFANSEDAQRFLREARSAAGLRHASIVQVHEIAHERGSPYIVSDFIDGLTLADLISGGRPGFRESAELVAQLADALDYAHRQKVIHRDIKPSNILLAAPDGKHAGGPRFVPYLTDFGLARRDEGEITVTLDGQVLGTPAYMSPEQAAGDHARVDGRSDVYSLGVVLYELLSGELPFRGSRRMLLHQVLHDEPRPPRTLNERISRDLETICLKAIAKEPARRYGTAADFRDDLRRFLRGDPITARRVGRPERAWRWCRRNPVIAGLAASLAVALVVGTAISSYLAFAERKARTGEEAEKGKAIAARQQAERNAARSLIAPLNPQAKIGEILSPPERQVLWELAIKEDDGLWLRFLDEGTRDALFVTALRARSEPAMIAAVGLSLKRRDCALALLIDRVRHPSLSVDERAEVACFALGLIEEPGAPADACIVAIREAMAGTQRRGDSMAMSWITGDYLELHWEPRTLAVLIDDTIRSCLTESSRENVVTGVLAANAKRLDGPGAERSLSESLRFVTSARALWFIGLDFAALAERTDLRNAAEVRRNAADAILKAIREPTFSTTSDISPVALIPLATRMDPAEGAAVLLAVFKWESRSSMSLSDRAAIGRSLVDVVAQMDDDVSSTTCSDIVEVLSNYILVAGRRGASKTLPAVVGAALAKIKGANHVAACQKVADALVDAARRAVDDLTAGELELLAEFTVQPQPNDAANILTPVAQFLTKALETETQPGRLANLAALWAQVAQYQAPVDGQRARAEAAGKLVDSLRTTQWNVENGGDLRAIITAVSRLTLGMDEDEARRVGTDAARVLEGLHNRAADEEDEFVYSARELSAWGISILAPLMQTDESTRMLTETLHSETNASIQSDLGRGLATVVTRIAPAERTLACSDATRILMNSAHSTTNTFIRQSVLEALAAIIAQLPARDASPLCTEAANALIASMQTPMGNFQLKALVAAFVAITTTLEREPRARLCADAARAIIEARDAASSNPYFHQEDAVDPVSLLAQQMEPSDAAQLIALAMREELNREIALTHGRDYFGWSDVRKFVDYFARCESRVSADATWRLAESICSLGCEVSDDPDAPPYSASQFDDLLSESPSPSDKAGKAPRRCRLTTPQLVELLKMPTCFGANRRVILEHLGRRYDRRFNTVWAFVRFAEVEKLGLDFTTPPVRPDPAKMQITLP